MSNTINIPNRINWIDWTKVIAISFVVFGHIPQIRDSFPQSYIVAFHMPFFFFISGYLTKKEYMSNDTLKKYWHTLIIPYFCYNFLLYPYWVIKHYMQFPDSNAYTYIKPIIGTFMLQCETKYFEPLNGVTWFIISLLGYKIILSICNTIKAGYLIVVLLTVICSYFYIVNEIHLYIKELTVIGFIKCLPFFYLGYICRQFNIISTSLKPHTWLYCLIFTSLSIFLFFTTTKDSIILFALRFWLICITAIAGLFHFCKLLDKFHFKVIENISIGTIVIMGFHFVLISTTNYAIEKIFNTHEQIVYSWIASCFLVILFESILYPIIIICKNKVPFMLGKRKIYFSKKTIL